MNFELIDCYEFLTLNYSIRVNFELLDFYEL